MDVPVVHLEVRVVCGQVILDEEALAPQQVEGRVVDLPAVRCEVDVADFLERGPAQRLEFGSLQTRKAQVKLAVS